MAVEIRRLDPFQNVVNVGWGSRLYAVTGNIRFSLDGFYEGDGTLESFTINGISIPSEFGSYEFGIFSGTPGWAFLVENIPDLMTELEIEPAETVVINMIAPGFAAPSETNSTIHGTVETYDADLELMHEAEYNQPNGLVNGSITVTASITVNTGNGEFSTVLSAG